MTDEIKEILDKLKNSSWEKDEEGITYKILFNNEVCKLLDYITNLQEESKKLRKALEEAQDFFNSKYFDFLDSNCEKLNKIFNKALEEENE